MLIHGFYMNKSSSINHVKELDELKADHTQEDLAAWVSEYGKYIIYGIVGVLAALFLIMQLASGKRLSSENEYIMAAFQFERMEKGEKGSAEALTELEGILVKHPELESRYDGPIGQELLAQDNVKQAETYIQRTLSRIKEPSLSLHQEYTQTTLQIAKGDHKDALASAMGLKEKLMKMEGLTRQYQTLYAFNLLRIAFLQQELGNKDQEKLAWSELKAAIGGSTSQKVLLLELPSEFAKHLQAGKFSLSDYIAERESSLG